MAQITRTLVVPPLHQALLHASLEAQGYTFSEQPQALWRARAPDVTVILYRSGKLVIQGRRADLACASITEALGLAPSSAATSPPSKRPPRDTAPDAAGEPVPAGVPPLYAAAVRALPHPAPGAWIGIDETGKGDYFGPLVVGAVRVSLSELGWLAELGVSDSKGLTDARALDLAGTLETALAHEVLVISPARYNELYAEFGNLNRMLAWAHAKAANAVLERASADLILSDQFARGDVVARQMKLNTHTRAVRFIQRTRAENDPAVAAASVLARARFLRELKRLEKTFGVRLAKGAGSPVLKAGRDLVRTHGAERLRDVAKLHFRTTQQIGG